MKKAVSLILILCLVLSLAGCKNSNAGSSSTNEVTSAPSGAATSKNISLLYSYSDSFNPYTAKTAANRELSLLLYDPLVKTDNNFEPQLVLAKEVKLDGTVCTIKLNDATFTDGSAVTSDDVVFSYNLAKQSVRFSGNFYEITEVSTPDKKTVVFTLSQKDPYFINLLDFPIIKSGTADVTNKDGKEIAPIGCGRYVLSNDSLSLVLNKNYYGPKGVIQQINLINSPDQAATSHYVEVGATYVYYDDSGDVVRMSGKKKEVNLNRFVYIGINSGYGSLATKELRYAISAALDREILCQTAYYNNAVAAKGFFNPSFKPTNAVQTIDSKPNYKITVENLAKIGYNNMNSGGFYSNSSGNNPVFTLLVNSENASRVAAAKLIAEQCKTAGIEISVVECDYAKYVERLTNGDFQLYLGEVQLLDNMDLSALVTPNGSAAYGVFVKEEEPTDNQDKKPTDSTTPSTDDSKPDEPEEDTEMAEDQEPPKTAIELMLQKYHSGECGIGDIASILITEMPQIPICYLNGNLFYSAEIKGGIESSSSDIYLTIQNYVF